MSFDYFNTLPLNEQIAEKISEKKEDIEELEEKILAEQIIKFLKSDKIKQILRPSQWYYIELFIDYLNGWSYKEIKKKYRIKTTGIFYAINKMKKLLKQYLEE